MGWFLPKLLLEISIRALYSLTISKLRADQICEKNFKITVPEKIFYSLVFSHKFWKLVVQWYT